MRSYMYGNDYLHRHGNCFIIKLCLRVCVHMAGMRTKAFFKSMLLEDVVKHQQKIWFKLHLLIASDLHTNFNRHF